MERDGVYEITVYRNIFSEEIKKKRENGGDEGNRDEIFFSLPAELEERVMKSLPMQQTAGFICIIPIRPRFPSGSLSTHDRDVHSYTHS